MHKNNILCLSLTISRCPQKHKNIKPISFVDFFGFRRRVVVDFFGFRRYVVQ